MKRTSHPFIRLAVFGTTVVGLVLVTAGRAAAQHPRPDPGSIPGSGYEAPIQPSVADNSGRTLQWVLFTAAVLATLAIVAIGAEVLGRRRWRQPPLETVLASSDADELPRAAGLLGDLFVQQHRTTAAEHAYRAAIDVSDAYLSPIAQVALAQILGERGERTEAQALLEAAIASGHPRAVPAAVTSLNQLQTGKSHTETANNLRPEYETLG